MKRRLSFRHLLIPSVAVLGLFVPEAQAKEKPVKDKTVPVQVLSVNDFHGAINTSGTLYLNNQKYYDAGGASKLSTVLNNEQKEFATQYKANKKQTIRVQSGDLVGASPSASSLLQDEPTIKVFNALNMQVGTLGNHEFDEGISEFYRILNALPSNSQSEIVQDYPQEKSKMQIVNANVVKNNDLSFLYDWKPYTVVKTTKGAKIGFIGIDTTDLPNLVLHKYIQDYKVLDPAEQIVKYSKELRKQGVNAICVLSHTSATEGTQLTSEETKDILDKVNTLDKNNSVDVFIAAHNHVVTNAKYHGVAVAQAASQGKAVANIEGKIDKKTHDFVKTPEVEIVPVTKETKEDPKVKAIVEDAEERVEPIINQIIGSTASKQSMSRRLNSNGESQVGDLIATAQLEMAKKQGIDADFAMTNNGGIRNDLITDDQGNITWGAAQSVQPFGNILQVVKLKGDTIYKLMQQSLDRGNQSSLQIAGFKMQYTADQKVSQLLTDAGEPIDKDKTYTVIANDFICTGGSGYTEFLNGSVEGSIGTDTEVFVNYIKTHSPIATMEQNRKQQVK